jgi:fucose 4-O-acetylase-like acetyltransferase
MEKRIAYIDIARGIGILLIVLGHNDLSEYHPFLHKFVYSFHIPLFFFLSGMFFKPERPFRDLLKRRFDSLLKPFLFIIFAIYLFEAGFGNMTFPVMLGRIAKSLYANGFYLDWVQLWFIPHLFAVNLFAFAAWHALFKRIPRLWLRLLILFGMLALGVATMKYFMPFSLAPFSERTLNGLPFSLDLVLASGFFFLLGYEVNQKPLGNFLASPLATLGLFGLLIAFNLLTDAPIDFNTRTYSSLWVNTAEALIGICLVLSLSKWVEDHSTWLTRLFSYLGRISLVILIFHVPIQEAMGIKFSRLGLPTDPTIVLAFLSGVLFPVLFYEMGIHLNPRLRPWFGFAAEESSHREEAKDAKEN